MKLGAKYLTWTQRLTLEKCYNAGLNVRDIAANVGMSQQTVYRELKRGACLQRYKVYDKYGDFVYKERVVYSADVAQDRYIINATSKGVPLKIGKNFKLVEYIQRRIIEDKLSPHAIAGELKRNNCLFGMSLSKTTIYRYIETGIFPDVLLEYISPRAHRYRHPKGKRAPKGTSIEQRPDNIAAREEFGHWEIDCVCCNKLCAWLTLSERLTRKEFIFKMPNQKSESVVKCINKLEWKFGKNFKTIFKSITADNGSEFSDFKGMEQSIFNKKSARTKVYYCHPYSAYERGTNERLNREIRRLVPKGSDLSAYSEEEVKNIEDWVNRYPRSVLGFATSEELFNVELAKISS